MLFWGISSLHFWSSIPAHNQTLGFSSLAFFLPASLLFIISMYICHLLLSALPIHSLPSSTNLCFLCASPLGLIYHSKSVWPPLDLVSLFLFVFLLICWTISSVVFEISDYDCTALSCCRIYLVWLQQQLVCWTFSWTTSTSLI